MTQQASVAVVHATLKHVAIWWVSLTAPTLTSRLAGAWVLPRGDDRIHSSLLPGRIPWLSPTAATIGPEGPSLDPNVTLALVDSEIAALQAAFVAEQDTRVPSKRLIPPRWPTLPGPWVEGPDASPDPGHHALAMARWLAALAAQWDAVEEQRLARPLLRDLRGSTPRALPVALT